MLIDLRPFLLSTDRVSRSVVEGFLRFVPTSIANSVLARLGDSGHLCEELDVFVASAAAREFARRMTVFQSEVMKEVWLRHGDGVRAAMPIASDVVEAATGTSALPLFTPLARLPEPDFGEAFLLHHRLTLMRYLRADTHVAELTAAGLTCAAAKAIDAVRQGDDPADLSAVPDGWLDDARHLSSIGTERRKLIESKTNNRVGAFLTVVGDDRVGELERLLAHLPD